MRHARGNGNNNGNGRRRLLQALVEAENNFISGESLGRLIGASRAAVWKHIKQFRSEGILIDSVPNRGYRLSPETDSLNPLLLPCDEMAELGFRMEYSIQIGSTNTRAHELARQGCPSGTVVVSEVQNTGKGRLSRRWLSPTGGLWMSLVARPNIPPAQAPFVTVLTGAALARTLSESLGVDARIKWPNDILIGGRKVCGVLTEMDAEMAKVNHIIIGIGMNVNNDISRFPKGLRDTVTTLSRETGGKVDRPKLFLNILRSLDSHMEKIHDPDGREEILDQWREMSATLGKKVKVEMVDRTVVGTAKDIDEDGALLVDTRDGEERVLSGDCVHMK